MTNISNEEKRYDYIVAGAGAGQFSSCRGMPRIITGPGTNVSAHMIGGRAAKLIPG